MHLLSEMWLAEGVRREGERAQQLVFMREGLKSKGWASSKTWLSCAICHSGTRLPLDPAPPFPAVPHQRFAATFVWHKFCTRKQSNTQGAVGGVTFYEHAMHILIKWQAEWQTNCQPACSALLCFGLAWPGKLGTVLIMQICRANWFGRQAQLCQQSRKQNAAYAQFEQKATANVCKYNAHTPRKQHTHNRNLSPTRTLGENWKGISRAAEEKELEEGK